MIIVCVAWFLMTESAAMDDGKSVWVPHPIDGFKLGRIVDIGADGVTVEVTEKPAGQKINAPFDRIYPAEEYDDKDVEDNCKNIHCLFMPLRITLKYVPLTIIASLSHQSTSVSGKVETSLRITV